MNDDKEYGNSIIHKSIILIILGFVALIIGSKVGPEKFAESVSAIMFIAAFLFLIWGISLRLSAKAKERVIYEKRPADFSFWGIIIALAISIIGGLITYAITGK